MNRSGLARRLVPMSFAAFLVVLGCCPYAWAEQAVFFIPFGHARSFSSSLLVASDADGSFDLEWCQRECRMRYGLEPTGGGIGGHAQSGDSEGVSTNASEGSYSSYAACIADCNRRFWDDFDKRVGSGGQRR